MELNNNVIIENRSSLSLSGVTDVENFDENEISLYTSMGDMVIRGKNLHVESVSIESGNMNVTGEIRSLVWGDKDRTKKPTLWQKMTR